MSTEHSAYDTRYDAQRQDGALTVVGRWWPGPQIERSKVCLDSDLRSSSYYDCYYFCLGMYVPEEGEIIVEN